MRSEPPGPAHDLRRLAAVHAQRDALDAEWIALAERLRTYDPPVAWAKIGEAAGGMTDAGVINAVRRARKSAAATTDRGPIDTGEPAPPFTDLEEPPTVGEVLEHGTA